MVSELARTSKGLAIDPMSGEGIQFTSLREDQDKWVKIRDKDTAGVIPTSLSKVSTEFSDGLIYVADCTELSLIADIVWGSLTTVKFIFRHTDHNKSIISNVNNILDLSVVSTTATISSDLSSTGFWILKGAGDDTYIIRVPLMNSKYISIWVDSVTTNTNSKLGLWIGRGNGLGFKTHMAI